MCRKSSSSSDTQLLLAREGYPPLNSGYLTARRIRIPHTTLHVPKNTIRHNQWRIAQPLLPLVVKFAPTCFQYEETIEPRTPILELSL
jgi:hypothetical protein